MPRVFVTANLCQSQAHLSLDLGCQVYCTQRPHFQRAKEQNCLLCKNYHKRPSEIHQVCFLSSCTFPTYFVPLTASERHFIFISTVIHLAQTSWKYITLLKKWTVMMRCVLYMFFWNGNGYVVLQYREKIFHFVVRVSDANTISCCRKKILKHRGRLLDTE